MRQGRARPRGPEPLRTIDEARKESPVAAMYTDKVLDHFANPRNIGEVEDPDGVGEVGNPVCGDVMRISIRVEGGRLADVKFKTLGCAAAIAVSSITTEVAKGKTLEEALELTRDQIAEELGGLPPQKMHCSNLAVQGLHKAIKAYLGEPVEDVEDDGHEEAHSH